MRTISPIFLALLACAALLTAGCAGEKSAVKNEAAPAVVSEAPAVREPAVKPAEPAEQPKPAATPAEQPKPAAAPAASSAPGDPVARFGTSVISRKELDRALTVLTAQNRIQAGTTPEEVQKAERTALDQLIFAELLYQQGLKTPPADLDKQVESRMSHNKAKFGSPAEYEAALKSSGISEQELKEITRKDIVFASYFENNIIPSITVSDEEIRKFYDDNRAGLAEEPQVKASHILIGVDAGASAEVKAKAKAKAEAVLKEIRNGKDFAAAAKEESSCPSKEQGGDLGFFGKGQMVPEFEKAAFALKPGEISDVVETQFGYHIIKVTEKKEADIPKFEDMKEKIATFLKGQKTQKAVFDYVTKLRGETKVEILL